MPPKLSAETPVQMSVARFWAILVTCVTTTASGAIYGTTLLRDIRDELKSLNHAVSASWTVADQERWAASLRWENRQLPLQVPSVHEVRQGP